MNLITSRVNQSLFRLLTTRDRNLIPNLSGIHLQGVVLFGLGVTWELSCFRGSSDDCNRSQLRTTVPIQAGTLRYGL